MFATTRRVEFRDTDAAGIMHFSAFFPMMESAEHEMLRSLQICVLPTGDQASSQPRVSWPRVSAKCDYTAAVRFEDLLRIEVSVSHLGRSSVTYSFRFLRDDAGQSARIATGSIVAVCCRIKDSGLEKVAIPDFHRRRLQTYLDVTPE